MDDARNLQYGIGFDTADAETSVENLGEKVETLEENIGAVEVGAQQMGASAVSACQMGQGAAERFTGAVGDASGGLDDMASSASEAGNAAKKAAGQSYAPYSKFHVGAAALLEDGTIVTGSNQENAAYPSGLCAERVALFHAGHQYPDMPVVALAIAAATNGRQVESISPCGACRQVLLEAEQRYGKPMKVLLCGTKEVVVAESAESLLPLCFGAKDLK